MSKWNEKRLSEVFNLKYGKALTAEKRVSGKYKVYSSAGVCGYFDEYSCESGIVVGRKGTVGSVFYSSSPFFTIDTAFYIDETPNGYDLKYLYYFLQTLHLEMYNNDAAVPGLNRNLVSRLKGLFPSLPTQQKIADILSTYDDLIENNNQRIELLEKVAQDIYKEWFVRMRFPGYKKVKLQNGIPHGWEVIKLENVVEIGRGSSPRPIADQKYFEDGNIPWIKIADATASKMFVTETKEYINEYGATFSRKLKPGSLILAASGTLGFPMFLGIEGCIHDGWLYFDNFKGISPNFLYYNLIFLTEKFNAFSYGAAIQNINTGIVKNTKSILPPVQIQNRFDKNVNILHEQIQTLQTKNLNLIKQRDLLLPRLLSGKLEV